MKRKISESSYIWFQIMNGDGSMEIKEKFLIWLAWHLPKQLVKWCAVRVMVNAAGWEYPNQIVPELTVIEALQRWK